MRLKTLLLVVISVLLSCKKEQKILSNSEKVMTVVQEQFGPFNKIYYGKDSTRLTCIYNLEGGRTEKVKGVIDKTMNLVGVGEKYNRLENELIYGPYEWETPTEKITLSGGQKLIKDSTSYLNVWIEIK